MPPATPLPPDPGSIESLVRLDESITVKALCRLRTLAGRVNAEVAIIKHAQGNEAAVLVFVPATERAPLRILHALPITSTFSSSLLQTPPSPSVSFFAQSSKPHIDLILSYTDRPGFKVALQFAPTEAGRTVTLMKEIRKAVDSCFPTPYSHAWLSFYPETEGGVPPQKSDAETISDNLEASFGKVDMSDESGDEATLADGSKADANSGADVSTESVKADTKDGDETKDSDKVEGKDGAKVEAEDEKSTEKKDEGVEQDTKETDSKMDNDSKANDTKVEKDTTAEKNAEKSVVVADKDAEEDKFPNPYTPGFSRTGFLRKRLFQRQQNWSFTQPVSLRVVTYNVNDRLPPDGTKELGPIIGNGSEDIIAVGLQEVDLRSTALFVSQGTNRAVSWEQAIFGGLGDKKDEYEKIATVQYVGVLLLIVARKTLRPHITMVQECAKGIGLLGVGGNKAGVSVRLKVHDTAITFISSHLAAFANQLDRRRSDYVALRNGLTFPCVIEGNPALEAYYNENAPLTVDDSDVIFWFGDLNYRLDMQDHEIRTLVEGKDWENLLLGDQLLGDISESRSFRGFSEPPIRFRPSFKYVHGSVTLDPKRSPAFCDRALHLTRDTKLEAMEYTSHELLWSDHLPVSCTYSVDVRVVDEAKRSEELVSVQCELDKLDELYRASLAVDVDELDFGTVKYRRPEQRKLVLHNTGLVPATFSFRAPAPGKPICKPWFWPFPASGVVGSGEEVDVFVTADVDERHCRLLSGGEEMGDVLVLQVSGGKDTFVSLRAQFEPTIVGLPLELLPDLPDVITKIPLAERKTAIAQPEEGTAEDEHPKNSKPPRELWRLLEKLIEEGGGVEKLWTDEVDLRAVLEVIDTLDTGADLPDDIKAIAHALLHLLYALPTPLVPDSQKVECQTAKERYEAFGVVEKIPGSHANVLIGLMSVAKLCAGADPVDDASVKVLGTAVFGGPTAGRDGFVRALIEG